MNEDFESLRQRKIESLMEAQKINPQSTVNNEKQTSSFEKLFELSKQYEEEVENFKKSFGPLCEQEWNTLSEEQRIKIWYYVCNQIYVNEFVDKGSYRHLIYTLFNFGPEAYSLGMDCGLMQIHNSITMTEDLRDNAALALRHFGLELPEQSTFEDFMYCLLHGITTKRTTKNQQLSFDF
jgi:hypothetical protein